MDRLRVRSQCHVVDRRKDTFWPPPSERAGDIAASRGASRPSPRPSLTSSLLTQIPENRKLKKLPQLPDATSDGVQKEGRRTGPPKRAGPGGGGGLLRRRRRRCRRRRRPSGRNPRRRTTAHLRRTTRRARRCSQLFYVASPDKSMKATSEAYFSWVSRILPRAPFEHSKPSRRKALNPDAVNCAPEMSGSKGQKVNASLGFTAPRDEEGKDYAPDLSGVDSQPGTRGPEGVPPTGSSSNPTALRKILRKSWDKANHSTKGRQTRRGYRTDSQYRTLFYSPLIQELEGGGGDDGGGPGGTRTGTCTDDEQHDDDEHAHANVDHSEGTGVLTCSNLLRHALQTGRSAVRPLRSAAIVWLQWFGRCPEGGCDARGPAHGTRAVSRRLNPAHQRLEAPLGGSGQRAQRGGRPGGRGE